MKRTLQFSMLFLALGLLGLVGWLSTQKNSIFYQPIKDYELVSSINQLTPQEVDEVIAPYLGRSFWDIPLNQIQANLMHLDWVQFAEVKRKWPNLLYISIKEQTPVARWGEVGLLNGSGDVFFPRSIVGFENLVRLEASLEDSELVLKNFIDIERQFKAQDMVVSALSLSSDKVWTIQVLHGPQVVVDSLNYQQKLQRFIKAYPQLEIEMRKSARVYDLRYSNGFIVAQN